MSLKGISVHWITKKILGCVSFSLEWCHTSYFPFSSSSVGSLSHVWLFTTPWTAACQASLSITNSRSSLKLMSIKMVAPSKHLILCRPLSSCLQSFPTSGSFPMSQFFALGGQSFGASASASVLPMNIQNWFPLGLTGWSPCSPRDSQESSPTPQLKSTNSLALSFFVVQLSHPYVTTGKIIGLTRQSFVSKIMFLHFNMLSKLIIAFLSRIKRILISWLHSVYPFILQPKKIVCHYFHCFSIYLPLSDGTRSHDLLFLNVEF